MVRARLLVFVLPAALVALSGMASLAVAQGSAEAPSGGTRAGYTPVETVAPRPALTIGGFFDIAWLGRTPLITPAARIGAPSRIQKRPRVTSVDVWMAPRRVR
jgi:hypothetical protein